MKHGPSRHSLRWRLLAGMLLTVLITWLILLVWIQYDRSREHTGEWDVNLQVAGQIALESLPRELEGISLPQGFRLSKPATPKPDEAVLTIQAYSLKDGRLILRSPAAPTQPLVPSGKDGLTTTTIDGVQWRAYALTDADHLVQIQVAKPLAELHHELNQRLRGAAYFMAVLFVLLAGVAWAITYATFLPVMRLSASLRKRPSLDLDPLSSQGLPEEMRPLVDSFNRQLSRVSAAVENERRFLQDAAHELRTPLAVLSLQAENALRSDNPAEIRHSVQQIHQATQRSARMSEQLLDMARLESTGLHDAAQRIDLDQVTQAVVQEYQQRAQDQGRVLVADIEPCQVSGHLDSLGILLRNLLDNALRYGGDTVRVECRPDAAAVRLAVLDNGPGVPQAYRGRILDRFYRMPRAAGHGSGIGLSLVVRIARLHGAQIEVGTGIDGAGLGVSLRLEAYA